ncbi:hypothetical protein G4B88_018683 [Cannabis sativa]|uniref:Uncharacterized protein n=1 Tax=Cannabis sativa TaxID=3483 RepID=A0A7J6HZV1_CANSA|nr:hypothetical protein G4B88_018683 [Cannabis sativa]
MFSILWYRSLINSGLFSNTTKIYKLVLVILLSVVTLVLFAQFVTSSSSVSLRASKPLSYISKPQSLSFNRSIDAFLVASEIISSGPWWSFWCYCLGAIHL